MLGVSSITITKDENQAQMLENLNNPICNHDFHDFADGNLLESINFDDLFVGINDGDALPDLEMDPEILAEFSIDCSGTREDSEVANVSVTSDTRSEVMRKGDVAEEDKDSGSNGSGLDSESSVNKEEAVGAMKTTTKGGESTSKGKKSSTTQAKSNNNKGKKKVKVDWTPELHRRFVQAVEQLGVDKAVPSRILELMGIDCLTRHNIASHLQKYRSHRKHLIAREAEAASWSQRRQMYSTAAVGGGGIGKMHAPTMGFPPAVTPMHPAHFRPLHVWGHPTMEQSLLHNHTWTKPPAHVSPPPTPSTWASPPPNPSYWHHHRPVASGFSTPGTPFFPQPLAPPARFPVPAPPVAGIPSHQGMYEVETGQFDHHPSKESVDAAIGDVLTKPWLPLPLGLKPPSIDSVMTELQRQGIARIPPPTSCS